MIEVLKVIGFFLLLMVGGVAVCYVLYFIGKINLWMWERLLRAEKRQKFTRHP